MLIISDYFLTPLELKCAKGDMELLTEFEKLQFGQL